MVGIAYCNMCKNKIADHDDEALARCVSVSKIVFWKKSDEERGPQIERAF